jgi:serine/threonine protein kinase
MGSSCQKRPKTISLKENPREKNKQKNINLYLKNKENNKSHNEKANIETNETNENNKINKRTNLKLITNTNNKNNLKKSEFIKGRFIGQGKFSSVFYGLASNTGEIFAIQKIFLKNFFFQKDEEKDNDNYKEKDSNIDNDKVKISEYELFKQKLRQKVKQFSLLDNKNIIKYYKIQENDEEKEIEIILEFCSGGSIKQLLDKFDYFDEKLIKLYSKQIVEGLVYLHERNIIHMNLRNTNILVNNLGVIKLSDFAVVNTFRENELNENINYNDDKEKKKDNFNNNIDRENIINFNKSNKEGEIFIYFSLFNLYNYYLLFYCVKIFFKCHLYIFYYFNFVNFFNFVIIEIPYYLAPEIFNTNYKPDFSLDIWSLGCLIIEMATNSPPWSNLSRSYTEVIELISKSSSKN